MVARRSGRARQATFYFVSKLERSMGLVTTSAVPAPKNVYAYACHVMSMNTARVHAELWSGSSGCVCVQRGGAS